MPPFALIIMMLSVCFASERQQQPFAAEKLQPPLVDGKAVRGSKAVKHRTFDLHLVVLNAGTHCRDDVGYPDTAARFGITSAKNVARRIASDALLLGVEPNKGPRQCADIPLVADRLQYPAIVVQTPSIPGIGRFLAGVSRQFDKDAAAIQELERIAPETVLPNALKCADQIALLSVRPGLYAGATRGGNSRKIDSAALCGHLPEHLVAASVACESAPANIQLEKRISDDPTAVQFNNIPSLGTKPISSLSDGRPCSG